LSVLENPVALQNDRIFSSKLLLFGEYSVIIGGRALAIPLSSFRGMWKFEKGDPKELFLFSEFLEKSGDFDFLDIQSFKRDLEKGLFFDSDIPLGYGMGSSGALVAGVFFRYSEKTDLEPARLKSLLGKMENFFHGSSSGLDPLVSLLGRPILIERNHGGISFPENLQTYSIFLIDTGLSRNTGPLVNWFLNQLKEKEFRIAMEENLVPANDRAITHFLEGNFEKLFLEWGKVGELQKQFLPPMVPEKFKEYLGLSEFGAVKLCGAGGGGFLMGIAKDKQSEAEKYRLNGIKIIWI
jgi:mevalonate kinase